MINIKLIGCGAAGNKGTIEVIKKEVLTLKDILLVNSTIKDIPIDYRSEDNCFVFDTIGGCGKETSLARRLTLLAIEQGGLDTKIDNLVTDDTDLVIINASTSGGTGAGSAPVIAEYVSKALGVPVCIIPFTGFDEDGRGFQNTIEFFQNLEEGYVNQSISNKKFLDITNSYSKAEQLANEELAMRISVMAATGIVESDQNMDETDLYKVATSPGYMIVNKTSLKGIRTTEQFDKLLVDMVNNDKSLDLDMDSNKVARLGIFVNASEAILEIMDDNFTVLKAKLGNPYEVFKHIQSEDNQEPYIAFIGQGLAMPKRAIAEIYETYQDVSSKINKSKDGFFDEVSKLKGNSEDDMFNVSPRRRNNKANKEAFMNKFTKKDEVKDSKDTLNNY